MSSRPQISPTIVIPAAQAQPANDSSMTTSIISAPTIIQKLSMVSYGLSWSGAPVGSVSVQVSNDYTQDQEGNTLNAGTWNTMTIQSGGSSVTSVPISGGPGNGFIDIDQTAGYAMRLVYTFVSGSGTLQVIVNGKVA